MRVQTLKVIVPDDMEQPDRLIRSALERYLVRDDLWREVGVTVLEDATEAPTRTVFS